MAVAIPFIAMALVAGGTAVSAVGSIYSANAQASAQKQQAENEKYQAMLNEQRAGIAQVQGETEASRRSEQIRRDIGSNRAAFASNGLLLNATGTVENVQNATFREGQSDISTIRDNAAIAVWGYKANAVQQRASSESLFKTAKATKTAGVISAVGTSLMGIGNVATAGASGFQLADKLSPSSGSALAVKTA